MHGEARSPVKICDAGPRRGVRRGKCSSRVFGSVDTITVSRKVDYHGDLIAPRIQVSRAADARIASAMMPRLMSNGNDADPAVEALK
jgi:hypothetical protein